MKEARLPPWVMLRTVFATVIDLYYIYLIMVDLRYVYGEEDLDHEYQFKQSCAVTYHLG